MEKANLTLNESGSLLLGAGLIKLGTDVTIGLILIGVAALIKVGVAILDKYGVVVGSSNQQ